MKFSILFAIALWTQPIFAVNDISNCYDQEASKNAKSLTAQGFSQTGTQTFEVAYYKYGPNMYWKTTTAYRLEKAGQISYATCYGIVNSPLLVTGKAMTLKGDYYKYSCKHPCLRGDWGWLDPSAGEAYIEAKNFKLAPLGGAAELVVNISAYRRGSKTRIDENVVLGANGNVWSNSDYQISLQVEDNTVQGGYITTRPKEYDSYDPRGTKLNDRDQFRLKFGATGLSKQVTVVDLPGSSGIRLMPSATIEFAASETSVVEIINNSSFALEGRASASTPYFELKPKERITLTAGIPSTVRLSPYSGSESILELKRKP